jgi:hypothetical protein
MTTRRHTWFAKPLIVAGVFVTMVSCSHVASHRAPAHRTLDDWTLDVRPDRLLDAPIPARKSDLGGWKRFGLSVGGAFIVDIDTTVRVDSATLGRGTEFELEDIVGLDRSLETFRGDSFFRFNRRHRIDASYFKVERDNTLTIDRQLQIGNAVFPINASLTTSVASRVVKAAYRYTLVPEDTWEVSASIGFHWTSSDIQVRSDAINLSERFETEIPLPVLGLHGEWHLLPSLRFKASTELLYLELSDSGVSNKLEGLISDTVVAFEWDAVDHVGVGLGYNYFYIDVDVDRTHLSMSSRYRYHGALLYAQLTF